MSALLKLRDYQREAIHDLHSRWNAGATRVPLVLATGLGKGHPLATEVLTPDGLRRWGDLRVGDRVFGRDGTPTDVTAIFDRGVLPAYRVTFSDGSSVVVDADHLWAVKDGERRGRLDENTLRVIDTRTLMAGSLKLRTGRGYRWHVPLAVTHRGRADLPLDPYVVGALISNGCMTGDSTQLTTPDPEVAKLVGIATECNKIKDATDVCDRYSLPGLTRVTRSLGMRVASKRKSIPRAYLESSREQRVGLLHGLMDGDGSARDEFRRSVTYHTCSEMLANDVRELVASLGGTASLRTYDRAEEGKPVEYQVGILLPAGVEAFRTGRKAAGQRSVRNLQPKRAIVDIHCVGRQRIRCITVAAEDHLYQVTRQHIVTHNTVIFAHLVSEYVRDNPSRRALILVHTDELVQQAWRKVKDVAPDLRVGIVKAGRNEVTAHVIVASVQTLRNAGRRAQLRSVGLVVVDECHHATSPTYRAILEHFAAPDVRVAGFTATLARSDKAKLSDVWEACTFQRGIAFGIRRGYLTDVRGIRVVIPDLDLSKVKKQGGDFQDSSLADELDRSLAPSIVAAAYIEHASDRKAVGFAPTVASAEMFAEAFTELGVPTAVIHGKLPQEERRLILKKLHTGEIRVIWNCAVLTEGFDEPTISCVIPARPTRSAPLYQQMIGRGLRPDLSLPPELRGDCLVLDVAGSSRDHTLRTLVDLSPRAAERELEMDDLESLLELEDQLDQAEAEIAQVEPEAYVGETRAVVFDPLARTGIGAWLQTAGGTYFIPAGDVYVLICPGEEPGTYDVAWLTAKAGAFLQRDCAANVGIYTTDRPGCWCDTRSHQGGQGDVTEHRGLSLEMATSWGEEIIEELAGSDALMLADRKKAWRRSKVISDAQRREAARCGIVLTGEESKGEVSDLISTVKASRRIDPVVAFMEQARGGTK